MPRRRVGHTDLERCHRRARRDPSVRCGRCGGQGQERKGVGRSAPVATDKGDAVAKLEVETGGRRTLAKFCLLGCSSSCARRRKSARIQGTRRPQRKRIFQHALVLDRSWFPNALSHISAGLKRTWVQKLSTGLMGCQLKLAITGYHFDVALD